MRNARLYAVALLLAGCAGSKPTTPTPPTETTLVVPPATADSALVAVPSVPRLDSVKITTPPTFVQKVAARLGIKPKTTNSSQIGRIGKKSTVQYFYGAATNTVIGKKASAAVGDGASATVTGKKSGPAAINSDSASLNTAGNNAQLTAVAGKGNTVAATKEDTQQEAPGIGATIAGAFSKPLGWLLVALLALVGYAGYRRYIA